MPEGGKKKGMKCEITAALKRAESDGTSLCLICKGARMLCGRSYCPLMQKISRITAPDEKKKLSRDMFGPSPPSIFVGHFGYPKVTVGPMSAIDSDDPRMLDDPSKWYGKDFDEIIAMRMNLVRSRKVENVKSDSRIVSDSRELALAVKPADVELHFKNSPRFKMSFNSMEQPMGPTGVLEKFQITENTKIPKIVDYVVNDEIRATEGATTLYDRGYDVYYLSKILSSGALGMTDAKKMVPTRWSITATDDMIAKNLLKEIREFPEINEFRVYSNEYLDNSFHILVMPGAWEFENFEAWAPKTLWTLTESKPVVQLEGEPHEGRSDYAQKEGGGYYAARMGIVEGLYHMRRQARVISFREINEGYVIPVGVWEVRENVRQAMKNPPEKFQTRNEALAWIARRSRVPMQKYLRMSSILRQMRIGDF